MKEIIDLMNYTDSFFDPYMHFEVKSYLTSYALCVHPSFRGLGIATEMLKARVEMLKALNLTVTSTFFTTAGSQIAAKKAGFEENTSLSYEELEKKFPSFDFSKASSKFIKRMSLKI
jgi:GNAT superfamily N-acetyltransferase